MNQDTLNRLISELLRVDGMMLVIDSGGAVSEMSLQQAPEVEFDGRWATIEASDWHIHLDLERVCGAQFVENSHHGHEAMPKLFYVRLSDGDGATLLRFYFPNPWLDDAENPASFQPERLRLFQDFRRRYLSQDDGIVFVQRTEDGDVYHQDCYSEEYIEEDGDE